MKKIIIVLVVVCAIPLLVLLFMFTGQREFGFGLTKLDDVPETASNINYFKLLDRATGLSAMDFQISEQEFKKFAESKKWDIKEISSSVTIQTASFFAGKKADATIVTNGLEFSSIADNDGGCIVVYERDQNRAYIFRCKR